MNSLTIKWALRRYFAGLGLTGTVEKSQLFSQFILGQLHDPDFVVFSKLHSDRPVLDIGANAGQSAISIYNANRRLKVMSFEPNSVMVPNLRFTKSLLGANFQFQNVGIGDRSEKIKLYIPVSSGVMLSQESTFDRKSLGDHLTVGRMKSATGSESFEIRETEMQVITVDSLNLNPCALKIDVQGFEIAVLRGAERTLRTSCPLILIESVLQNGEIADFLENLGYHRFGYDPLSRQLTSELDRSAKHRWNWFFIHPQSRENLQ